MKRHERWRNLGARLANYKAMHADTARRKDVYEQFCAAESLTAARKVLWGEKPKRYRSHIDPKYDRSKE